MITEVNTTRYDGTIFGKGWMGQHIWMRATVPAPDLREIYSLPPDVTTSAVAKDWFIEHDHHGDFSDILDAEVWQVRTRRVLEHDDESHRLTRHEEHAEYVLIRELREETQHIIYAETEAVGE